MSAVVRNAQVFEKNRFRHADRISISVPGVSVEFNNCMGEILVTQPYFAPYRFVKIEILSSDCIEDAHIFRWYDSENDSVDEVLFQICKCLDIAKNYNVQKDS